MAELIGGPSLQRRGQGEWLGAGAVTNGPARLLGELSYTAAVPHRSLELLSERRQRRPLERGLLKRVTDIHQMANAFRKLVKLALALLIGAIEALPIGIGRDKEGRFA